MDFLSKICFRVDVSDEETVIIKNDLQKTCVVEGPEHQPRVITECSYEKGDKIVVSYKQGTSSISESSLKVELINYQFTNLSCITFMPEKA